MKFILSRSLRQDLKSERPKCAIGTAQMENKTAFFKKWLSTGCLDTHLAKSLILSITCPQHLKKLLGSKQLLITGKYLQIVLKVTFFFQCNTDPFGREGAGAPRKTGSGTVLINCCIIFHGGSSCL